MIYWKIILKEYLKHQEEVIRRRTQFDLKNALDRQHILFGLSIAGKNIDEVIEIFNKKDNFTISKSVVDNPPEVIPPAFAKNRGIEIIKVETFDEAVKYVEEDWKYATYRQGYHDYNQIFTRVDYDHIKEKMTGTKKQQFFFIKPLSAEAEKLIVSVTTPSAVIVSIPLNVPAALGANSTSTAPSVSLTMLNASSPLNTTSTAKAFATENVAVPFAISLSAYFTAAFTMLSL